MGDINEYKHYILEWICMDKSGITRTLLSWTYIFWIRLLLFLFNVSTTSFNVLSYDLILSHPNRTKRSNLKNKNCNINLIF